MDCVRRELIHFVKVNLWELKVGCCGTSLGSDRHIGSTSTTDRLPVFASLQEQVVKRETNQFQIFFTQKGSLSSPLVEGFALFFAAIQLNCSQLILVINDCHLSVNFKSMSPKMIPILFTQPSRRHTPCLYIQCQMIAVQLPNSAPCPLIKSRAL